MMAPHMIHDTHLKSRLIYLAFIVGLSALVSAGWFGYAWYVKRQEQAAYKDLAESIDAFYKVLAASNNTQAWQDVVTAFTVGAQRHARSHLAPYFLAYQADALLYQGDQQSALSVMDNMISMLSKTSPLYYTYATKRALMKLDAQQPDIKQQAKAELEQLIKDSANPSYTKDMALYYAGLDAWNQGDKEQARAYWSSIANPSTPQEASLWWEKAQERMQMSS